MQSEEWKMKTPMLRQALLFGIALAILLAGAFFPTAAINKFSWRGAIISGRDGHFGNDAGIAQLKTFMDKMEGLGYNILYHDCGSNLALKNNKPGMRDNLNAVLQYAQSKGIKYVPISQGQLSPSREDSTVVEAFPSKGTPFVVSGGKALVKIDSSLQLPNLGFEDGFNGWRNPFRREGFFSIDSTVKFEGKASLRCKDPNMGKLIRIERSFAVTPFRRYELSMQVKTSGGIQNVDPTMNPLLQDVGFAVHSGMGIYLYNNREKQGVRPRMNWKMIKGQFSSLNYSRVTMYVRVTCEIRKAFNGTVWFDDIQIREVGLSNIVRRASLPIKVATAKGELLTEGADYVVGNQELIIPSGSRAREGDVLSVDWYAYANPSFNLAETAFCSERAWDLVRWRIALEDDWYGVGRPVHMKYNEWKAPGWDPACIQRYNINVAGSGPYTGSVCRITEQLYREANCNREVTTWNDYLDPYHNSKPVFHTSHGGNARSGFQISQQIIVQNWCGGDSTQKYKSLLYFAGLDPRKFFDPLTGDSIAKTTRQRQILNCGFYGAWKHWLPALNKAERENGLPDGAVIGIIYMSFHGPLTYDKMDIMADSCRAQGRWLTGPVPLPPAAPGCPATDPAVGIAPAAAKASAPKTMLSTQSNGMIRFTLSQNADVRLQLVDVLGRVVKTLVNKRQRMGRHDAKLPQKGVSAGVYFVNLDVDNGVSQITRKMVLF